MMWAHTVSLEPLAEPNDPVDEWFKRMLTVHGGVAGNALTIRDLS